MAKLKDVLTAKNPLSAGSASLTDPIGLWQLIFGVVIFSFVFAAGQKVAKTVESKTGGRLDTSPESMFTSPAVAKAGKVIY